MKVGPMGRAEELFARLEADGEAFLDELIATQKSEESFLDFKRSANNGTTQHLDPKDRSNLEKALSGFANSDGGVIVWGLDARKQSSGVDGAGSKHPLEHARRFASAVDGALSGCTAPPVHGARSIAITVDGDKGFAATLVPQSLHAPHQTVSERCYYIRTGSNFNPATHAVMAGMFGRAPRSNVIPQFGLGPLQFENSALAPGGQVAKLTVEILLLNDSSVVAETLYFRVHVPNLIGPSCKAPAVYRVTSTEWACTSISVNDISAVAHSHIRLAPSGRLSVAHVDLTLVPPFTTGFELLVTTGAAGAPPNHVRLAADADLLLSVFEMGQQRWNAAEIRKQIDWHDYAAKILGLPLRAYAPTSWTDRPRG